MGYLKNGETYRSRLEDLLTEVRSLPANANANREKARDEAALLIAVIHADAAEALVSATLTPAGEVTYLDGTVGVGEIVSGGFVYDDDLVRHALDGGGYGDADVLIDRLRRAAVNRLNLDDGESDADREGPPYSFTPDALARVRDSLAFDVKDGEPTPRLPGEQTVATDPEPEVDFEMEVDVTADTLDEIGKSSDLDALDPTDDLDEDDPDLADFRPASKGKPATLPETPLQKAKKAHSKKETKK